MAEMLSFPRNMSYYIKKLSNFHINTLRLTPMTATTVTGGSLVSVRLPTNALVKVDSLNMYFTGAVTNGRLPVHSASLINRVDVRINGQSVHQGGVQHWNLLYNMLFVATGTLADVYKNAGLQYSQPALPSATFTQANQSANLCVSEWLGTFIDTCRPQVLHTSLTGEILVDILVEQPLACVINDASANGATLSLSNIYFTVDVINFDVDVYTPMLFQRLQAGEKLPVYYNHIYNFEQAYSGQQRISCVSQSIDMLLATARPSSLTTVAAATAAIAPYATNVVKRGLQFVSQSAKSDYSSPITSYNWNIDGQVYPLGGNVDLTNMYQHVLKSFGHENNVLGQNLLSQTYEVKMAEGTAYEVTTNPLPLFTIGSSTKANNFAVGHPVGADFIDMGDSWASSANYKYNAFLNGNFMMVQNLKDYTGSDERYISGYDTKGSASNIFLNITAGGDASQTIDIFALCSSTLYINPSQLLEVVY